MGSLVGRSRREGIKSAEFARRFGGELVRDLPQISGLLRRLQSANGVEVVGVVIEEGSGVVFWESCPRLQSFVLRLSRWLES